MKSGSPRSRGGRAALALERIIAGGQTGVDRAALDAAEVAGLARGGWCPPGRAADDGVIPAAYPLSETPEERSPSAPGVPRSLRTEWNVRDADAVLVLRPAAPLDPGTEWTTCCAARYRRPLLVCELPGAGAEARARAWLAALRVRTLDVAGPSERARPGIAAQARAFLDRVLGSPTGSR